MSWHPVLPCLLLGAGLLGSACGASGSPSSGAPPRPAAAAPAATAVPPAVPARVPTAGSRQQAQALRVIDGDTLELRVNGKTDRVRLIGINTPESVDPRRPVECFGKEASAKATELLRGADIVEVEADPSQGVRDAYGRLLLYVWLPDGRMLNRELIALGYGHEFTFRVPYRFQADFRAAQNEAETARLGLWAPGVCSISRRAR